ncbi:hypothetical protein CHF27_007485 [Romboutsia maritimum]|uniref:Uncharacterized protein n=1 Tax=Romboutsia maritimum TaxID=2020948 RepID=A0A371ISZ4_9FIRM|nr:hypothetical protein [Romboutsia maritimum]RDY23607.1 hypothetical protein CHF27_007485 [Romboutsia maritimum]
MAKKRKLKKNAALLIGVIAFFIVYFVFFNWGKSLEVTPEDTPKKTEAQEEDSRSLLTQISSKKKIYISDQNIENIKVEEEYWNEIKFFFSEFSKVREPESYTKKYEGYSDDGIKFSTDLNYFRVYTVNNQEYYKVPISIKKEFEALIKESIYTSFDFIKQYKTWENVTISYNKETKKISGWKYDDLAYKMASKRLVGKVQPEKSKERSKYNFTINIKGEDYEVKVETMGQDYVKIISKDAQSYYEVHNGLYEYIKNEIFEIGK